MPRTTSSFLVPRSRTPTFSPARPSSRILRNISTPVTVVFWVFSWIPTISTSSPVLTTPRSTRPVTTVPRPVMVKTSSIGIRKGLSRSRSGCGMYSSTASMRSRIDWVHFSSPWRAWKAEMRTTGQLSPSNSCEVSSSRTSISTSSMSSSSSTMSHLLRATTMAGTPT